MASLYSFTVHWRSVCVSELFNLCKTDIENVARTQGNCKQKTGFRKEV